LWCSKRDFRAFRTSTSELTWFDPFWPFRFPRVILKERSWRITELIFTNRNTRVKTYQAILNVQAVVLYYVFPPWVLVFLHPTPKLFLKKYWTNWARSKDENLFQWLILGRGIVYLMENVLDESFWSFRFYSQGVESGFCIQWSLSGWNKNNYEAANKSIRGWRGLGQTRS